MKRSGLILGLLGLLVLVGIAIPVMAQNHFDPHPHMLLQRPEFGLINGVPHLIGVRQCIDLANNRSVPNHAHHEHLHFGDTGVSFGGEAGHAVIPAAYFPTENDPLPWSNCQEFEAFLPLPIGG